MKTTRIKLHHSRIFFLVLFSVLLMAFARSNAQTLCSATAFINGASFGNDNSIGNSGFLNPSSAASNDNTRSISWATLSLLGSAKTNYLTVKNFNFSIPPTATICGVTAIVKKRATGVNILNWVTDEEVKLIKGGTIMGTNKATSTRWIAADQSETYGGTTDKWGLSLTAADVNSSDFGIAIAAGYKGVAGVLLSAEIDYVQLQLNYNVVLPLLVSDFKCQLNKNKAIIEWTTDEEEEHAAINLERSKDQSSWELLKTYTLKNNRGKKQYKYTDDLKENGRYYYRIRMKHANGETSQSQTSLVSFNDAETLEVFPNPASNWIKISSYTEGDQLLLFNMQQQVLPINLKRETTGALIDISKLQKGIYFLRINNKVQRFIKE